MMIHLGVDQFFNLFEVDDHAVVIECFGLTGHVDDPVVAMEIFTFTGVVED